MRALAADPDHAPAAERLAEIYATRGRWADVEELLDVVIDGLEPGETDRLVALEMKLAEACVQLGKTDKNKMDKALDSLARAHEARAESLPVLHKYGDLRMQRREWKDALTHVRIDPARPAPDAVAGRGGRDGDADGACHVELGNPDDAFAAYKEAKTFDPKYRPALDALAAAYAAKGDWAAWVVGAARARRHRRARGEGRPRGRDRRRVRRQAVGRGKGRGLYRAALELEPARRSTLHKLLDVYTKRNAGSRRSICSTSSRRPRRIWRSARARCTRRR